MFHYIRITCGVTGGDEVDAWYLSQIIIIGNLATFNHLYSWIFMWISKINIPFPINNFTMDEILLA